MTQYTVYREEFKVIDTFPSRDAAYGFVAWLKMNEPKKYKDVHLWIGESDPGEEEQGNSTSVIPVTM